MYSLLPFYEGCVLFGRCGRVPHNGRRPRATTHQKPVEHGTRRLLPGAPLPRGARLDGHHHL